MSLDMVPADNTYDDTTNTMTVTFNPNTDFCLASAVPNAATHLHASHLIIQNVEDLVGWQVRLNYDGGKMRPLNQNVAPFAVTTTAQNVGFTNLPVDPTIPGHRDITSAASIPPQASGPQSALVGAVYNGDQIAAISPDTPAKSSPDDTSYSAPNGGVLSQINLQVVGNQTGQTLFMNLDDASPNAPGSTVVVFTGAGITSTLELQETSLGDGLHVEGGTCPPPTAPPTQGPTPTATPVLGPSPTATASGPPVPTPAPTGTTRPSSTPASSPGSGGSFNPSYTATYCAQGTGDIDDQQLTVSCQPDISPGSHPDIVSTFSLGVGPDGQVGTPDDTNDYNFAGLIDFSPTVPDDTVVPLVAPIGKLGIQPTIGLLDNGCGNGFLRVPFTLVKGTTDVNNTVEPRPFGESNDLADMAGPVTAAPAVMKYPSFLNAIFDPDWVDYGPDRIAGNADDTNGPAPPLRPLFRSVGTRAIPSAGNLWVIVQLLTFDRGTQLPNLPPFDPAYGYPTVLVLQQASAAGSATPPAPSALTDFCSPWKAVSVSYGVTLGAIPIRTLPSAGTHIDGITYSASRRDADGDGYENDIDTCPYTPDTVWNPRDVTPPIEGDSDQFTGVPSPDGIPDSCDPTPFEPTAGSPANQPTDHDGDGFLNRGDNCPLVANSDQHDTDEDDIGDACDLNPDTPDGAEIRCIRNSVVVVGGDPSVAFSGCLSEIPPVGAPTPTPIGGGVGGGTATPTPAATPIATPVPTPTPTAPAAGGETCDGQLATKVGTDASEAIFGTNGRDVIVAKGGADVILGMDGDDIICAGSGGDLVVAGGGNDRVFGEGGGDLLLGGRGDDFLDGGAGFDHCLGGPGDDTLQNCERGPGRSDGHGDGNRGPDEGDREPNSSRGAFVDLAGAIY